MTEAQRRALEQLWPRFGVDVGDEVLDPASLFSRDGPLVVEIGFGNGEHLVALARQRPGTNFLGIEVHRPGVGRTLQALARGDLSNVRVACTDAWDVLSRLAAESAAEILILFPDPWPKGRHHKRRLIQPAFATLAASRLAPGGTLRVATDWRDYAEQIMAVLSGTPGLRNTTGGSTYAARPDDRQPTRYERRGWRLGHDVFDLVFERE